MNATNNRNVHPRPVRGALIWVIKTRISQLPFWPVFTSPAEVDSILGKCSFETLENLSDIAMCGTAEELISALKLEGIE